jgi:threonine/homoserine/homoserine lactone efflux protein
MTTFEMPALYVILTKGLLIGIATAALFGPVNFMVVRRGILGGFQPAFSVGAGAALMDALCAYAVFSGMLRMGFSGTWKILLWGLGAVLILYIGYMVLQEIRENPEWSQNVKIKGQTAFVDYPFVIGLLLVGSNPFSLLYWITMVSTLGLSNVAPMNPTGQAATCFFSSVLVGETLWYAGVSLGLHKSRNLFNRKWLRRISLMSGVGLLIYALFMATKVVVKLIEQGGMPFIPTP